MRKQLILLLQPTAQAAGPPSPGAPTDDAAQLRAQAEQARLWTDPQWLNLLHYEARSGLFGGGHESQVASDGFFLAADGASNPRAELAATLAAFYEDPTTGDAHAQCRYPARLHWLRERLPLTEATLPDVDCIEYREWSQQVRPHRVTLVFPAYYLNSPSSMFGHTLLRVDPPPVEGWSDWLSWAVNFGAEVDPDDNGLFYAAKGLTGGYPGHFNVEPYYKKIKEYNSIENRDIWEYPLNLTPEETARMVRHLWELKEIDFAYYFFDKNCSYRVLELLEVARPGLELTDPFVISAIPVDTVRAVVDAGLVETRAYRPSKSTELEQLLSRIPRPQHALVLELTQQPERLDEPEFLALSPRLQAQVVEAAYRHLRYQETGKARDPDAARRSYVLLRALRQHADNVPEWDSGADRPAPPENGHGSKRLSFGRLYQFREWYSTLGLRMSFHSLEENLTGFLPGAQINLGNLEFAVSDSADLRLERLDLVDIVSLTPRNRFFQPLSWRVITGVERQPGRRDRDGSVAHVTGGIGYTVAPWSGALAYALATARLEHNPDFNAAFAPAAGLNSGLLQHFARQTLRLEISGERFSNGHRRPRALLRHNLQLAREHALEAEIRREWPSTGAHTQFSLAYRYHF